MCQGTSQSSPPTKIHLSVVHFDIVLIISVHLVEFNTFITKLILLGNLQHGREVGPWHPSRLVKYGCKWDIHTWPVMKGLKFAHFDIL